MLFRHGLAGTFYLTEIIAPNRLSESGIRMLAERFGVGAHTLNHPGSTTPGPASKKSEIAGGEAWLEGITGAPVVLFAIRPSGRSDRETKQAVRRAGSRRAQFVHSP